MKIKVLAMTTLMAVTVFASTSAYSQPSKSFGSNIKNTNISEDEVEAAQEAWGKALIKISRDFDESGTEKATQTANSVLDGFYGYSQGPVLFKPTLTHGEQTFRTTREGALAYFVGGNKDYPNDKGFALKGWQKYEFKNAAVYLNGDLAITTGNIYLTDKSGKTTVVDKTWGFKKGDDGKIRIVLHHSSLPYNPNAK